MTANCGSADIHNDVTLHSQGAATVARPLAPSTHRRFYRKASSRRGDSARTPTVIAAVRRTTRKAHAAPAPTFGDRATVCGVCRVLLLPRRFFGSDAAAHRRAWAEGNCEWRGDRSAGIDCIVWRA